MFAGAAQAGGVDDFHFRVIAPARDQFGDQFGRVLKVGVHVDDRVAFRVTHPCQHALRNAEVIRHVDNDEIVSRPELVHQDIERSIRGIVVDKNQLIIMNDALVPFRPQHGAQAPDECGQDGLFVVERQHDR